MMRWIMLLSAVFTLFAGEIEQPRKVKTISYRGGVITFQIPADWKEDYQPEGGGMFYDDRLDSGTLRLNVLSFTAPEGKLPTNGYSYFAAESLGEGERLIKTAHGDGVKTSRKSLIESGTEIDVYTWKIVHCAPPTNLYIAVFTWTIMKSQSSDPKYAREIEFLTDEISKASFHQDLGKK